MDEKKLRKLKRVEVFLEFLVFGIIIGIIEDVIAILITTDARITWHLVGIVLLIAIPFAFIGEILVDRIDFVKFFIKNKTTKGD